MSQQTMRQQIDNVMKGSYDIHVYTEPDPNQERRLDALDTARQAYEAEMAGFMLKSHEYPTAPMAAMLNRVYPGLHITGSLTLNPHIGGLNPEAVKASAGMGARVIWMPTRGRAPQPGAPGINIIDTDSKLVPAMFDIIDIIAANDMVLASGFPNPKETFTLFREAKSRGVKRLLACSPAPTELLQEAASMGARVEFIFISCMPPGTNTPQNMAAVMRSVGIASCVLGTSFGQVGNPPPPEGMRMAIAALLAAGLCTTELAMMAKRNPQELLGIAK